MDLNRFHLLIKVTSGHFVSRAFTDNAIALSMLIMSSILFILRGLFAWNRICASF
jgi:hypothetical protein